MKSTTFRITALALSTVLFVAACQPGGDKTPANGDANANAAAAPAESGDKVAADITGAGATFIYPIISKWSADYNKQTGNKINYQSIGSGGGIAQIKAGTVDFGSSDKPLISEELAARRPRPVPVGDRRRRAGGQHRRRRSRQAALHRPAARRHLPRQDHEVERPGDRRRSTRA